MGDTTILNVENTMKQLLLLWLHFSKIDFGRVIIEPPVAYDVRRYVRRTQQNLVSARRSSTSTFFF
jgi:hypothetical protein